MICYDCDGQGWLYLSEFREATPDGIIGDDHSVVFTKSDFDDDISICPDCDGYGEWDDFLPGEEEWITEAIKKYENLKGFYRYYSIDFDAHKATLGVCFAWHGRRWHIISGLPTFSKFARMWK